MFSLFYLKSTFYSFYFLLVTLRFILSIVVLIFHSSLVTLFLSWDGLGITSLFLVIYYLNWSRFNRAIVTVLSNRIGDGLLLWTFLSLSGLNITLSLFLLGISTKRAQLPYSSWLPMAMRAPTPISSLVHSSTLVTAGIYTLISYFNLLFCRSFLFLNCVGLLTLVTSGVLALLEQDGKKVVALRTLNQLGFIVTTIALGLSQIVLFHLLSHAFFKRIIFMQLGYFISILLGSQKLSNHSLLYKGNRFNILLLLLINFTLLGLIISLGFTSKERLLIIALFSFRNKDSLALWLLLIITLRVLYSVRLWGSLLAISSFGIVALIGSSIFNSLLSFLFSIISLSVSSMKFNHVGMNSGGRELLIVLGFLMYFTYFLIDIRVKNRIWFIVPYYKLSQRLIVLLLSIWSGNNLYLRRVNLMFESIFLFRGSLISFLLCVVLGCTLLVLL